MSRTSEPRHGRPESARRDGWGLDKYIWPDGPELAIYDDGGIKIGRWGASVTVFDVSNYRPGKAAGARTSSPGSPTRRSKIKRHPLVDVDALSKDDLLDALGDVRGLEATPEPANVRNGVCRCRVVSTWRGWISRRRRADAPMERLPRPMTLFILRPPWLEGRG